MNREISLPLQPRHPRLEPALRKRDSYRNKEIIALRACLQAVVRFVTFASSHTVLRVLLLILVFFFLFSVAISVNGNTPLDPPRDESSLSHTLVKSAMILILVALIFFSVLINNLSLISFRPYLSTPTGASQAMLLLVVPCIPVILFSGFLGLVREGKEIIKDRHLTPFAIVLIVKD